MVLNTASLAMAQTNAKEALIIIFTTIICTMVLNVASLVMAETNAKEALGIFLTTFKTCSYKGALLISSTKY